MVEVSKSKFMNRLPESKNSLAAKQKATFFDALSNESTFWVTWYVIPVVWEM